MIVEHPGEFRHAGFQASEQLAAFVVEPGDRVIRFPHIGKSLPLRVWIQSIADGAAEFYPYPGSRMGVVHIQPKNERARETDDPD